MCYHILARYLCSAESPLLHLGIRVNQSQIKTIRDNHRQSVSITDKQMAGDFVAHTGKSRRKEGFEMDKETVSVQELSTRMGISLPKAYALIKEPDFPVIRIGTRILIPTDAFREWLVIHSQKE